MSKVPHNLIGVLLRKKIIEGGTGTGILLSPNVVLTSAAAIYNLK
jgi:V8-like Glu-specific endopeptidase